MVWPIRPWLGQLAFPYLRAAHLVFGGGRWCWLDVRPVRKVYVLVSLCYVLLVFVCWLMQLFPFHFERCSIFCECFGVIKTSLFLSPESIALIFAHTRTFQLDVSQIRGATTPVPHSLILCAKTHISCLCRITRKLDSSHCSEKICMTKKCIKRIDCKNNAFSEPAEVSPVKEIPTFTCWVRDCAECD
jgi:hypothetical protein